MKSFEEVIYLHSRYIDRCRNIIISKHDLVDRYASRLRKLKRISERLEKILQSLSAAVIIDNKINNNETIEKLHLLLFYIDEIAIPSEKEIWRRLSNIQPMVLDVDIDEQLKRIERIENLLKTINNALPKI
uniref:CHAD domain-containing protein n=1 Tax=Ignisphaera aggregans TaxID=334771 RepID=A0A7C5TIU0_9CREN